MIKKHLTWFTYWARDGAERDVGDQRVAETEPSTSAVLCTFTIHNQHQSKNQPPSDAITGHLSILKKIFKKDRRDYFLVDHSCWWIPPGPTHRQSILDLNASDDDGGAQEADGSDQDQDIEAPFEQQRRGARHSARLHFIQRSRPLVGHQRHHPHLLPSK